MGGALGPAMVLTALGLLGGACNGTTGDQLVSFTAFASGAHDASQPFAVGGFTVQLTAARMRIGAARDTQPVPAHPFAALRDN